MRALLLLLLTAYALCTIPLSSRISLETLYDSTNGPYWLSSTNWLQGDPCDRSWRGVTCSSDNATVVGLDLRNNNLTGTLPQELNLPSLVSLYVKVVGRPVRFLTSREQKLSTEQYQWKPPLMDAPLLTSFVSPLALLRGPHLTIVFQNSFL